MKSRFRSRAVRSNTRAGVSISASVIPIVIGNHPGLPGAAPNLGDGIAKEVKRARIGYRIQLDSFAKGRARENALDRYFEFLPGVGAGHLIDLDDQIRDVTRRQMAPTLSV